MAGPPRSFDTVVVLECSQIRTPDAFWDSYAREVAIEGRESFGRNLDALCDALVGREPGWPGKVSIELYNVEALERAGYHAFVASLERLGKELEDRVTGPALGVIRRGTPARGRLYQHRRLTSRELEGATVVRAACWRPDRADPRRCGLL